MKTLFTFLLFLFSIIVSAQLNFQSVIRNSSGQIVANQTLTLRFTIKLNSTTGTTVYSEIHQAQSNGLGVVNLVVGSQNPTFGVFSQINWSLGTHYLTVEFYTGTNSCQWVNIPTASDAQIVSLCNGIVIWGACVVQFPNLVWSDEFNNSGAVNTTNWHYQTQLPDGNNWYNGEEQHYTNRSANSSVSNGILSIIAKKETYTDQGITKQYTSARLNSKFAFKYGKVEVRAKLPLGGGTWPAIWMLGKNVLEPGAFWSATNGNTNWPYCGEIDIMEHWGNNQNYVQSAMHTPSSYGGTMNLGGQTIPTVSSQFHIYTLEWTATKMVFSVDGTVHYIYNPSVKNASTWPFDAEQYIILNVAMQSSIATNFTQSAMEVDYVRVYQ
jgi:beta-glucanase (GH16 family)